MVPPTVAPDLTGNFIGMPLEFTFVENLDWRLKIQSVEWSSDNGANYNPILFTPMPGKISTLPILPVGLYKIRIKATGYADVEFDQLVTNPVPPLPPVPPIIPTP